MSASKWAVKKLPVLGSSQNPEEMSLLIKGVLTALIPVLIGILSYFKVEATQEIVQTLINAGFGVVAAVMVFLGALRKFKKNQ
jgi:zinc transporter ZupT